MSAPAHRVHYTLAEYLAFEASTDATLASIDAALDVRELYDAAAEPKG